MPSENLSDGIFISSFTQLDVYHLHKPKSQHHHVFASLFQLLLFHHSRENRKPK